MITSFWRPRLRLAAGAAAAAAAAALAAPAQAALVQGDWDPAYGVPFPELGWRGTTIIDVPLACLALSGTVVNDGVSCPLMTMVGALVQFYDIANPVPTVETLDFGGAVDIDRIFVSGGYVTAFALDSTGLVLSGVPAPGGDLAYFGLDIDFAGDITEAVLTWYEGIGNPAGGRNDPGSPAIVHITQSAGSPPPSPVSLPATLALALTGIALLGATRRRG
jgi:hypothetical protein